LELEDTFIVQESHTAYNAKITKISTEFSKGNPLNHNNRENYSIVFFNAFTKNGLKNIETALTEKVNIARHYHLKNVINKNRLWKYLHANSVKLSKCNEGDNVTIYSIWDRDKNDFKIQNFGIKTLSYFTKQIPDLF